MLLFYVWPIKSSKVFIKNVCRQGRPRHELIVIGKVVNYEIQRAEMQGQQNVSVPDEIAQVLN
ncbi:hypothetical protein DGG96_09040 [Legionella qingyii]|uniref:Uncharacterized protein n=1 Tax=Legionella qingyii TaxID=2184757 RepID=A0A317U2Z5_9GAMM|nr:hypothetical protein DGG96_09040 [Legionella qingyii]